MVLTETDRQLVAVIQDGLPLTAHPYAVIGEQLGISEADVIVRLSELQSAGLIKRMGVVVNHRALGYRANAMVVWDVPDTDVERVGELLAGESCITLCYQRPRRGSEWPYNLFCMIHGRDRDVVRGHVDTLVRTCGLEGVPHEVLFSRRRFKQRGARCVDAGARSSDSMFDGAQSTAVVF